MVNGAITWNSTSQLQLPFRLFRGDTKHALRSEGNRLLPQHKPDFRKQTMFSHSFYNVVHVIGIALVVLALGGAAVLALTAGTRDVRPTRRLLAILHGVGALLVLLGGFGMLARLGIVHGGGFPGWIWVKLAIWAAVAAALFLPYRRPAFARPLLLIVPVLIGLAAYMAIYKPV
jgi:hypothetical protein